MTWEIAIIGAIRVGSALPVLRWPLAGALFALVVDFSDLFLMNLIDLGGLRDYQQFDKYADLAYMMTFAIVAARWPNPERAILLGLFAFRMIGVVAFAVTDERGLLPFFPNLFEFFFIFVAAQRQFQPNFSYNASNLAIILPLLLAPKLFQEYALHEARWLDDYRATDVVEDWWNRLTG
jgi:hypothetical protein